MMDKLKGIINNKLENANNELYYVYHCKNRHEFELIIERVKGQIEAYKDVLTTIEQLERKRISLSKTIKILEGKNDDGRS